jgi:hypothetical protein
MSLLAMEHIPWPYPNHHCVNVTGKGRPLRCSSSLEEVPRVMLCTACQWLFFLRISAN